MKKVIPFLFILLMLLTSCAQSPTYHTAFIMDSPLEWNVTHSSARELIAEGEEIAAELEALFSATCEESDVSRVNDCEKSCAVDSRTAALINIANHVKSISGGAYDISVRALVSLWGITHHGDNWSPPNNTEIKAAQKRLGKLTVESGNTVSKQSHDLEIDFGGIGKGYTLGVLASRLCENGASGIISFGGNVVLLGDPDKPYKVGVKNPIEPTTVFGTLKLSRGMVAVGGGYERYVEYEGVRYHHIIDPATGYPSDSDLASALVWIDSVTPESGAYADALSTAFFVLGSEKSMQLYDELVSSDGHGTELGLLLIKKDGSVITTGNLEPLFEEYK